MKGVVVRRFDETRLYLIVFRFIRSHRLLFSKKCYRKKKGRDTRPGHLSIEYLFVSFSFWRVSPCGDFSKGGCAIHRAIVLRLRFRIHISWFTWNNVGVQMCLQRNASLHRAVISYNIGVNFLTLYSKCPPVSRSSRQAIFPRAIILRPWFHISFKGMGVTLLIFLKAWSLAAISGNAAMLMRFSAYLCKRMSRNRAGWWAT